MPTAGVLNAAAKRKMRVPEDISIIGYNNSIITQCTTPPLSSIDNGLDQLCELAVNSLVKLFNGETVDGVTTVSPRRDDSFEDKQIHSEKLILSTQSGKQFCPFRTSAPDSKEEAQAHRN